MKLNSVIFDIAGYTAGESVADEAAYNGYDT